MGVQVLEKRREQTANATVCSEQRVKLRLARPTYAEVLRDTRTQPS